jgi:Holliday junction resolvasome RuvABC endonuclease subunit
MSKPNVYIGIDPAPMSTGIAVRIGCSIMSTTIKYKIEKDEPCLQKNPEYVRIGLIYDISDNILTWLHDHLVTRRHWCIIGIEAPLCTCVKSPITWSLQVELYTALYTMCRLRYSYSMIPITANQTKKALGLTVKAQKPDMVEAIHKLGIELATGNKRSDGDIADAIAISFAVEKIHKGENK